MRQSHLNDISYYSCAVFLFICALFDLKCRKIPNRLIICAACAGAVLVGTGFIARFTLAMLISYSVSHLKIIGAGDLKMFSVIAGLCGIKQFLIILLVGFSLCAIICGALILSKKRSVKDTFPMAPYMLLGYVCWRCICVAS